VLSGIDLDITAGEIVVLIGPSGCGKSTLLRHIGGLDSPTSGTIDIGGAPVTGLDARSAIAFQEPRLLPWRSITRNVEVGLPRGKRTSDDADRVADLLELVKLSASAHLRPREISGGMAQRVSLARALARRPGVLLLDEPFGALDALTRLAMQDLLLELHAVEPATIVIVTHDVDEARYLADRVILLAQLCPKTRANCRVSARPSLFPVYDPETVAAETLRNSAPNCSKASGFLPIITLLISTPTSLLTHSHPRRKLCLADLSSLPSPPVPLR